MLAAYLAACFGAVPAAPVLAPPDSVDKQQHVQVVESLQDVDPPSAFGLPANATQLLQLAEGGSMVASLQTLAGGTVQADVHDQRIAPAAAAFVRAWTMRTRADPELLQLSSTAAALAARTVKDPVGAFVVLEAATAARLLATIHSDVADLQRADALPSAASVALAANCVPATWASLWDGGVATTPQVYAATVARRVMGLQQLESMLTGQVTKVDLSTLFRPAALMAALRQEACVQMGLAADELTVVAKLGGSQGVELGGVRISGALAVGGQLQRLDARTCVAGIVMHIPCGI